MFQTEFGTVAIQICYDWFFPEVGAIFGLQGAEIIFAPTWGTTFRDNDGRVEGETVFRVRARDNGVYLVPSVYDGSSMVIDPLGRILVSNKGREGVFWCEVDLNQRRGRCRGSATGARSAPATACRQPTGRWAIRPSCRRVGIAHRGLSWVGGRCPPYSYFRPTAARI